MASARLTKTKNDIKKLSAGKRERGLKLAAQAEFMEEELTKLREDIRENGWVEEYQNGANQHGLKKSTAGDVYNTLVKNYMSIMKQIEDILPDPDDRQADELLEFIK